MTREEIMAALGGTEGGAVTGTTWVCVCGEANTESSNPAACLALFAHRRAGLCQLIGEAEADDV